MNRPAEICTPGATTPVSTEVAPDLHAPPTLEELSAAQLEAVVARAEDLLPALPDVDQQNTEMGIALIRSLQTEDGDFLAELGKRGYWFPDRIMDQVREDAKTWIGTHLIGLEITMEVRESQKRESNDLTAETTTPQAAKPVVKQEVAALGRSRPAAARRQQTTKKIASESIPEETPEEENAAWEATRQAIMRNSIDIDARGRDLSLVRLYINQASREPLLDKPQEAELAKRIEVGLFAYEKLHLSGDMTRLPVRERRDLQVLIKAGDRAKQQLIEANLRWVIVRASKKTNRGVSFADLIQEGNMGLMRAAEMFDYKKGFKFSGYATNWIDRAIDLAILNTSRSIRLPKALGEKWNALKATERELIADLGRKPTWAEWAEEAEITEQELRTLSKQAESIASLDKPVTVGEMKDTPLGDLVPDRQPDIIDQITATPPQEANLTDILSEQEIHLLTLVSGTQLLPLDKIGEELGMTSKQVQNLRDKLFAKLQHPSSNLGVRFAAKPGNPVAETWREEAACKDEGPLLFFPEGSKIRRAEVASFCGGCSVAAQCLRYAVDQNSKRGFWGGVPASTMYTNRIKAAKEGREYVPPEPNTKISWA